MKAEDLDALDFGKGAGLMPAIIQHAETGVVLMLGYMNRAALLETLASRRVVFFSRSRQRLWEKGETSGHCLTLVDVRADCDRDTLLVSAHPQGSVCHLGSATCFGVGHPIAGERLGFLDTLGEIIEQRLHEAPKASYTSKLMLAGSARMAQKVGEEALEVALAAVTEGDERLLAESADLMFHLLVLLRSRGLSLRRVVAELEARHRSVP